MIGTRNVGSGCWWNKLSFKFREYNPDNSAKPAGTIPLKRFRFRLKYDNELMPTH
jgi:hypothetical protein